MARLKVDTIEGQLLRIKALERELHINHFHLLSWHLSGSLRLCPRVRGRLEGTEPNVAFIYSWVFVVAFCTIWASLPSWQSIRFQLILWTPAIFFFFSSSASSPPGHHQKGRTRTTSGVFLEIVRQWRWQQCLLLLDLEAGPTTGQNFTSSCLLELCPNHTVSASEVSLGLG